MPMMSDWQVTASSCLHRKYYIFLQNSVPSNTKQWKKGLPVSSNTLSNKRSLLTAMGPTCLLPLPLPPSPPRGHCYVIEIIIKQLPTLGEKSTGSSPLQSNATIVLYLLLSSAWQKIKSTMWSGIYFNLVIIQGLTCNKNCGTTSYL